MRSRTRCHRLCSSPDQVKKEIEFTINLYEDNGHDRAQLKHIADTYTPPNNNNNKNKRTNTPTQPNDTDAQIKTLFDLLPFKGINLSDDEDKLFACIAYVPEIAPQMKRALTKAGVNTTFTSSSKLKDILCNRNKTNPPKPKKKGIYKYTCNCSEKATYIGQTHRSCETRWSEHERAIHNGQWQHSGLTQHYENCPYDFDKDNFTVIQTMQDKFKGRLAYNLKIREAFEIRRHNCGPGKGLNEDNGAYLKTDIWDPLLKTM